MARIFIISNRVGLPTPGRKKSAGGLEVALRATLKQHSCIWLGWSGEVKASAKVTTRTIEGADGTYIVTDLSKEDFQEYYNGFANRVLWPILHYRLDLAEFLRQDLTGYMRVNAHFADELAQFLTPEDHVWVHDYHLIPLAMALREKGLRNRIGFFLHIPLPPPEILTALPNHERLIPSLCHYDLVGFQTNGDAENFKRYLAYERARNPRNDFETTLCKVHVGVFPVGIETESFQHRAERAARTSFVKRVKKSAAANVIIGVDRLDYSKGLTLKFDAYQHFLKTNAKWRGNVTFMQITPKSRSTIQEYVAIEQHIETTVGHINGAYGDVSWTPVRYVNRAYSRTALAGLYRSAQVGLVTPLRDGMNLVAKEYVAAQDPYDPGVLILSRFAGAAEEFTSALLVNPYDPESVGNAIARALDMPLVERRTRHERLFAALRENDIKSWGEDFLAALTQGTSDPHAAYSTQGGLTGGWSP